MAPTTRKRAQAALLDASNSAKKLKTNSPKKLLDITNATSIKNNLLDSFNQMKLTNVDMIKKRKNSNDNNLISNKRKKIHKDPVVVDDLEIPVDDIKSELIYFEAIENVLGNFYFDIGERLNLSFKTRCLMNYDKCLKEHNCIRNVSRFFLCNIYYFLG